MFSRCINTMARSSALPVLMLPKVIACNPDKDIFDIGREAIGCDWIELVEAEPLAKDGLLMMIDEEGKLKPGGALINATASALYTEFAGILQNDETEGALGYDGIPFTVEIDMCHCQMDSKDLNN